MPLRDHFRLPAVKAAPWEAVHAMWPMAIVQDLGCRLPRHHVAHPRVRLGGSAECDVLICEKDGPPAPFADSSNGGVATAVWTPARPTLTIATELPAQAGM